jgi:hypothetical protein
MPAVMGTSDGVIFWAMTVARLLLPLIIPRYPLPGIVASLVLDAVDQPVFQEFTTLPLGGYQGYDKALDIYYLTIAYVSTLRNWRNRFAFRVGRFLFYWRLAGVALFELTHLRSLLLILPNTFEYFFIFYEAYRVRWDPAPMSRRFLIRAAAFIWIVIKLPQEYWIHIGQLDTTDWIKTSLLRFPGQLTWREIIRAHPGESLVGFTMVGIIVVAVWRLGARRLPPADRVLAFSANAHQPAFTEKQVHRAVTSEGRHIVDRALVEKILLITLVSISFAQVIPAMGAHNLQLAGGLACVVTANTALSHWLARRGFEWVFSRWEFAVLGVANLGLLLAYALARSRFGGPIGTGNALLYALLLTLLITLFDRYRQVYLMRFGPSSCSG